METIFIPSEKELLFNIKNTGGNTGCFINTVTIEGEHQHNFKLLNDYNLKHVKSNTSFQLKVKHLANTKNDKAKIVITYNSNSKAEIALNSK